MATIFLLGEGRTGWVLYDDDGRTEVLSADLTQAILEATRILRADGQPPGGWGLVEDPEQRRALGLLAPEVCTLRFFPRP